jgi:hypothetical protein
LSKGKGTLRIVGNTHALDGLGVPGPVKLNVVIRDPFNQYGTAFKFDPKARRLV